jgi:hypothetical protein
MRALALRTNASVCFSYRNDGLHVGLTFNA